MREARQAEFSGRRICIPSPWVMRAESMRLCGNFLARNSAAAPLRIAHTSLGDASKVTPLRIEWPSGIVQELSDVAADQHLTIVESQGDYPGSKPAIASVNFATDGLQLTIQEPGAGWRYAVEGSTDLEHWAMLLARTSTGGTQSFTDTMTTNYPARFYRVIVP
jgi:hypothetical protein